MTGYHLARSGQGWGTPWDTTAEGVLATWRAVCVHAGGLINSYTCSALEFFTIGIPVRLSDRSLHREGQTFFFKNCPQWGLKPGPPDHQANALPTELGSRSVGQEISEVSLVCFMHHFTCWTLFISRINRAWLYKGHGDSGWQLNVDLAQLVEHWPYDPEVLVSIPTGGNIWRIFFCSSLCKDLSHNLTEMPIVKNSIMLLEVRTSHPVGLFAVNFYGPRGITDISLHADNKTRQNCNIAQENKRCSPISSFKIAKWTVSGDTLSTSLE